MNIPKIWDNISILDEESGKTFIGNIFTKPFHYRDRKGKEAWQLTYGRRAKVGVAKYDERRNIWVVKK